MKRFYIFLVLFFIIGWAYSVNAQDLIILKNGNVIEAKVLEISPTEIRYKRIDHLDGPTIVIMAVDVLSIRYENGKIEVINAATQPSVPTPSIPNIPTVTTFPTSAQAENQPPNPRLNTIGATLGYQGVSAFGFSVIGTVSPANYTFFDFNLGLGFNSFSFNGRVNFNAFVPFKIGGWYAGAGIGGGYNEIFGGIFAGNITTGFILFNWLNIAYSLQIGTFEDTVNHNVAVGYSYRFKPNVSSSVTIQNNIKPEPASVVVIPEPNIPTRAIIDTRTSANEASYTVERVIGRIQFQRNMGETWDDVIVGDIFTNDIRIRIPINATLVLSDGNRSITFPGGREGRIDSLLRMGIR